MSRKPRPPVQAAHLQQFVAGHSDFGFELEVLKRVSAATDFCEHGGTYFDPVTQKPRQFDIRAVKQAGHRFIRFAVEVKRLDNTFPLLISSVPRIAFEAYHDLVISTNPQELRITRHPGVRRHTMPPFEPDAIGMRIAGDGSFYPSIEFVGKAMDQVGVDDSGQLKSSDSEVYGKWSQAVASAADLIAVSTQDRLRANGNFCAAMILPVLVVPNETLWECRFSSEGAALQDPVQVDRSRYYLGKAETINLGLHSLAYRLANLEVVTVDGLEALIRDVEDRLDVLFPDEEILKRLHAHIQAGSLPKSAI